MKKSMIELADEILNKENQAMTFLNLWNIVSREMGFTESQAEANIAQFFSDLSIDGRFVSLPGNTWDLRKRHTVANTIVDTDSISVEDEEDFLPEEEEEDDLTDRSDESDLDEDDEDEDENE